MPAPSDYGFWGEYEHGVDDKGRVIIPQDLRARLGDEFVVTRGPDRAIYAFPVPVWEALEPGLKASVLQRQAGFLQRMLGGRAYVRLDPQFRLAIPKHLREWAGITSVQTAILIGQGQKIEVWSKPNWDAYNERFTYENMFDAAEAVGLAEVLAR